MSLRTNERWPYHRRRDTTMNSSFSISRKERTMAFVSRFLATFEIATSAFRNPYTSRSGRHRWTTLVWCNSTNVLAPSMRSLRKFMISILMGLMCVDSTRAAPQVCTGTASNLYVASEGTVLFIGSWRGDWTRVCNLDQPLNGVGQLSSV